MVSSGNLVPHPVQMTEVVLTELSAKAGAAPNEEEPLGAEVKIEVQTEASSETLGFASLVVDAAGQQDKGSIFSFRCRIKGRFEAPRGGTAQQLETFLKRSAVTLLLPFARETLSNITARMGLPPLILPLIDARATIQALVDQPISRAGSDAGGQPE